MTAAFMDLVDVTIVNIAIPSIQQDAGASFSQIQWITAGYALAFAAGLITGGRLGDIHGRKRLFLVGIGGFTLASALCGFAANPEMLVASRILQGGMAALMVPQVLSIVHATFPAHERGKVFGLFGAIVGLGAVSGPLLGALLTEWNLFGLEWRPIFLINLPVGIAGLILGSRFITESKAPQGAEAGPGGRRPGDARPADAALPADPRRGAGLAAVGVRVDGRRARRPRACWWRTRGARPHATAPRWSSCPCSR